MLRTPDVIAKKFDVAAEAGQGRAIPRALLAYSGPNKVRALATSISMIMNGALPEYGQKLTWSRDIPQRELAASASVARETITRWLSEIATPDDSWNVERRLEQSRRTRELHQRRGHRLHDRQRPLREHLDTLIHRRRRFMKPNRYQFTFPGHVDSRRPGDWFPPRPVEAQQHELVRKYFPVSQQRDADWWESLKPKDPGFKHIPVWVWSPRVPLSLKARLVLTFYLLCGLGSKDRKSGRVIGEIRPDQKTVARAIGLKCTRSVYNANRELAALGLIRVAHEHIKMQDGSVRSGRQIIVWLPIRYLTEEEAGEERRRLQTMAAVRQMTVERDRHAWMLSRVKELHEERLAAYMREEHQHPATLSTFWKAVRYASIAEGIHLNVINSLIPSPPE